MIKKQFFLTKIENYEKYGYRKSNHRGLAKIASDKKSSTDQKR